MNQQSVKRYAKQLEQKDEVLLLSEKYTIAIFLNSSGEFEYNLYPLDILANDDGELDDEMIIDGGCLVCDNAIEAIEIIIEESDI